MSFAPSCTNYPPYNNTCVDVAAYTCTKGVVAGKALGGVLQERTVTQKVQELLGPEAPGQRPQPASGTA